MSAPDVEARLRAALAGTTAPPPPGYDTVAAAVSRRQRRRRVAGGLAAALVAAALAGGVLAAGRDAPTGVTATAPAGAPAPPAAGSWVPVRAEPTGPRFQHQAVWTGREAVVLGGYGPGGGAVVRQAAAYDPALGSWRRIADAPFDVQVAAWTGTEVVAVGGERPVRSAAWDPRTDRWRPLGDVPLTEVASSGTYLVPAGGEVLAVGQFGAAGGGGERGGPPGPVARLDPVTGRWRTGAAADAVPIFGDAVWTGSELVVVGAAGGGGRSLPALVARAYDPAADRWRAVALPDTGPPGGPLAVAWTGDRLVIAGAGPDRRTVLTGPVGALAATHVAPVPVVGTERRPDLWTGTRLVAATDAGALVTFDPADPVQPFAVGDPPPAERREAGVVWTGEVVLVLGGGHPEGPACCRPASGGFAGGLP